MRDFRFGVNLLGVEGDFRDQVRAVEASGADVLLVPDHLGLIAPFPALVAAGQVAQRIQLGTFVLNAGFYSPALLERDAGTTNRLTGGRLELGLGAGYVADEFEAAGIAFPSAGKRVAHLTDVVQHVKTNAPDLPIMVAGVGNKVLTLAAQHADIVAFSNIPNIDTLAERVEFVKEAAGERIDDLELNLIIFELAIDREPNLSTLRQMQPDATDEQLMESMNMISGPLDDVVATLTMLRERFGVTYFTVIEPDETALADLARLITALRSESTS
ncbi:LLM class F420-dependent oxidoreductase [Rhodococcoides trifolii]|uniref:LLM class F420-dependent oxidoreductase n=1 Tax=Rhodococcoides trifolii TaxID=908250 RepID=A0A917CVF7_9NOCA|nr:TIGR03621 family F420-dependent LLM class oxidoreductase [Rhodococcus trifolii]GGF99599.1 LLM class F420-dependent oxidoreductase [Rhodococcus trifolii]